MRQLKQKSDPASRVIAGTVAENAVVIVVEIAAAERGVKLVIEVVSVVGVIGAEAMTRATVTVAESDTVAEVQREVRATLILRMNSVQKDRALLE